MILRTKSSVYIIVCIFLLIDISICKPPKKKKTQASSSKSKSKIASTSSDVPEFNDDELKIYRLKESEPCFFDFEIFTITEDSLDLFLPEVQQKINKVHKNFKLCRPKYIKVVRERLDTLGAIGKGITEWTSILANIAQSNFQDIEHIVLTRNPHEVTSLDLLTAPFKPIQDELDRLEMERSDPNFDSSEMENPRLRDWPTSINSLWKAWNLGLGVCVHLQEEPLRAISIQLRRYAGAIKNIDRVKYSELYYWLTTPDLATSKLALDGIFVLNELCHGLRRNVSEWRVSNNLFLAKDMDETVCRNFINSTLDSFSPGGERDIFKNIEVTSTEEEEVDFESLLDYEKKAKEIFPSEDKDDKGKNKEPESSETKSQNGDCPYGDVLELISAFKCMKAYPRIEDQRLSRLFSAIAVGRLNNCLDEKPVDDQLDELEKTDEFKRAEGYIRELRGYVESEHLMEGFLSLARILETRSYPIDRIETQFFFKRPVEGLDLEEAYKTGSVMCDIFHTDIWKHMINTEGAFVEMIQVFSEFYRSPLFRLHGMKDRNQRFFDIFHLWFVCSQIISLPIKPQTN